MADLMRCSSTSELLDAEYERIYHDFIEPVYQGEGKLEKIDFRVIKDGLDLGSEICEGGCDTKPKHLEKLTMEQNDKLIQATPMAKHVIEECLENIVQNFFSFNSILTWDNSLAKRGPTLTSTTFEKYWGILLFISFIVGFCRQPESLTTPLKHQYIALLRNIPCFIFNWWLAGLFEKSYEESPSKSLLFGPYLTSGDNIWKSYAKPNPKTKKSSEKLRIEKKIGIKLGAEAQTLDKLPYHDLLPKLRQKSCLNILMAQEKKKLQNYIRESFDITLPIPSSGYGRYFDYQYYSLCLSKLCSLRESPLVDISNAVLDVPDLTYPHYTSVENLYSRDTENEIVPYLFGHIGIHNLSRFRELLIDPDQAIFPVRCRISASSVDLQHEDIILDRFTVLLGNTLAFRTNNSEVVSNPTIKIENRLLSTVESAIKLYQEMATDHVSYLLIIQDNEEESKSEFKYISNHTIVESGDAKESGGADKELCVCFIRVSKSSESDDPECLSIEPVILLYGNPYLTNSSEENEVGVCYNISKNKFFQDITKNKDISVSEAKAVISKEQDEPEPIEVVSPVLQKTYILPSDLDKFSQDIGLPRIMLNKTPYLLGDAYLYSIMGNKKLVHNVYDIDTPELSLRGIVYLGDSKKGKSKSSSTKCGASALKVYDLNDIKSKTSCGVMFIRIASKAEVDLTEDTATSQQEGGSQSVSNSSLYDLLEKSYQQKSVNLGQSTTRYHPHSRRFYRNN